jgi:hypothetical protein
MANPRAYSQSYNFSAFSATQPSTPLPGVQVDVQLADISQASVEVVAALADVRNPDGTLRDGIVTKDSLYRPEWRTDCGDRRTCGGGGEQRAQ